MTSEVVRLTRRGGRVVGSARVLPGGRGWPDWSRVVPAVQAELAAFDHAAGVCGGEGPLVLQSARAAAEAGTGPGPGSGWLLVRAESPAGPLLLGAAGPAAGDACAAQLRAARVDFAAAPKPVAPAPDWRERPLLLAPQVAAAVVAGARMALASPRAARLDGRRLLPGFGLVDEVPGLPAGAADDAGLPAGPLRLLDGGRVAIPPRDPGSGLVPGRARWDHERARLVADRRCRLVFGGPPAPAEAVADRIDLLWCVEGLRRYFPDGRMRLVCLAVLPGAPGWFRVELTGRPLTLLRSAGGVHGRAAEICAGDRVHTPALLLPPAACLVGGEKGDIGVREV
ncbi:hypothetical protein ACWERV_04820 [Streptomyces sp. NPDC004031]